MPSAGARAARALWGDAGLGQRQALAASAISALGKALTFGRVLVDPLGFHGLLDPDGHLSPRSNGRQSAMRWVLGGMDVGLD